MVTNQDGLGTPSLPARAFEHAHRFMLELFASQGIVFDAVFICPHFKREDCGCRKPQLGMVEDYLRDAPHRRGAQLHDRRPRHRPGVRARIWASRACGCASTARSSADLAGDRARAFSGRRGAPGASAGPRKPRSRSSRSRRARARAASPPASASSITCSSSSPSTAASRSSSTCKGDLHIDEHHTVEDCALALGEALREALGDKRGIARYGFLLPMDEAEAQVAIDLSGRPYFVWEGRFEREQVGDLPTELVPHFFRSLAETLGAALHIRVRGENTHHMIEACFKGVGRACARRFAARAASCRAPRA